MWCLFWIAKPFFFVPYPDDSFGLVHYIEQMKTFLLTSILLFLPFWMHSQDVVEHHLTHPIEPNTSSFGDIDGDGDRDMVVSSVDHSLLAWCSNMADGNFSNLIEIPNGFSGIDQSLAVDMDGDTDVDICFLSKNDAYLGWFENNGNGEFSGPHSIDASINLPGQFRAEDIDNDLTLDIVVTSAGDNAVLWYQGLESGDYAAPSTIVSDVSGSNFLQIEDLNNDNLPDLIFTIEGDSELHFSANLGGGSFEQNGLITAVSGSIRSISIGDINNDLSPDIALAVSGSGNSIWLENNGAAFFSSTHELPLPTNPYDVYIADLNGDGESEIISDDSFGLCIHSDLLDNEFQSVSCSKMDPDIQYPYDTGFIIADDIDSDGILDLVFSSEHHVCWIKQSGDLSFETPEYLGSYLVNPKDIEIADLNNDGFNDLVTISQDDHSAFWYENLGNASYSSQKLVGSVFTAAAMCIGDYNGDGFTDVCVGASGAQILQVFYNQGDGQFTESENINISLLTYTDLQSADFDGDGDMDIAASCETIPNGKSLYWFRNDNNSGFSTYLIAYVAWSVGTIQCSDLDGDGDLDLLTKSTSGDQVMWYKKTEGGFSSSPNYLSTTIDAPNVVLAADIDGDYDNDVLVSSSATGQIYWIENLEPNTFGPEQLITSQPNTCCIKNASDYDGDGDIDILTHVDGTLGWHRNNGSIEFADFQSLAADISITGHVETGDLDEDGDLDIALRYGNGTIVWMENTASSGCLDETACNYDPSAIIHLASSCLYGAECGDFTGDGETNIEDLLWFLDQFGCTGDCEGDLNSDGVVNVYDLIVLLGFL